MLPRSGALRRGPRGRGGARSPARRRPWRRARELVRVALALSLGAAATVAGADPLSRAAPLGVTTPGPIRQLFLDATIADARAVRDAALSLRLETGNSWSVPTTLLDTRSGQLVDVQTDTQADALVLSARIPWTVTGGADGWRARVASTIGWRLTAFWGGFEDGGIEAWHHLIGSTNFLRQLYPRDHVNMQLANRGGPAAFDFHTGRISPGDLVVGTQALLLSGGTSRMSGASPLVPAWGVGARLDLKLPTGALDRAGGSGGVDGALSLLATAEVTSWLVLHGRASWSVFSPLAADVALQPRRFQYAAEVSAVALVGGWAFVLEDRLLSPLCAGDWTVVESDSNYFLASSAAALLRPHNQITVGVRRGPATLSLSEDFTPGSNPRGAWTWFYNSNAPDVVLALSVAVPL